VRSGSGPRSSGGGPLAAGSHRLRLSSRLARCGRVIRCRPAMTNPPTSLDRRLGGCSRRIRRRCGLSSRICGIRFGRLIDEGLRGRGRFAGGRHLGVANCCPGARARLRSPGSTRVGLSLTLAARRRRMYDGEGSGRRDHHRDGRIMGRECVGVSSPRGRRSRSALIFPITVKSTCSRRRNRSREPTALPLISSIRGVSFSAGAGRGVSRPRPFRAHLLQQLQPARLSAAGNPPIAPSCSRARRAAPMFRDVGGVCHRCAGKGRSLCSRPALGRAANRRVVNRPRSSAAPMSQAGPPAHRSLCAGLPPRARPSPRQISWSISIAPKSVSRGQGLPSRAAL